jgi:hypothetical protein
LGGGTERSGFGPNALILALLAVLGVGTPALRSSNASASHESVTQGQNSFEQTSNPYSHSAVKLLENFFDTNPEQVESDKPWQAANAPPVTANSLLVADTRRRFAISFLIATVPAPVSPSLRHEFDSYLNAIQIAVGRAGYVLDSFDVPWIEKDEGHTGDFRLSQEIDIDWGTTADPEFARTNARKRGADPRQSQVSPARNNHVLALRPNTGEEMRRGEDPGIILFRDDGTTGKRLLVLFLVGESPTRGINKTSLRDALDQTAWLSGWKSRSSLPPRYLVDATCLAGRRIIERTPDPCANKAREIRIIGPTFSGSAPSMRNALTEWLDPQGIHPPKLNILSGTATAVGDRLSIGRGHGNDDIEFHAVRIADSAIWNFARPFLGAGGDREHPAIAILSDDTSYGSSATGQDGVLRITFPVHISDVRNAVESISQGSPPSQLAIARHDIPIVNEKNQQQKDVIPLFSSRSAVYDELVLENLLATLNAENVRYIGIVATDVEDLLFLVHEIRKACPNTVVFTTSADLRYIHSDVNSDLAGMLVFSTYPLFSRNQAWTYPFHGLHQRLEFPGEDAEGVFNATAAQLDRADEMEEYGPPFAASDASHSPSPALWVGIVGRDNIWPIRFQVENDNIENLYLPPTFRDDAPEVELGALYPLPFQIAFLVLCLGCLVPSLGLVWPALVAQTAPSPGSGRSWADTLFGDAVFPELHLERWMRISAFLGALLIAFVVGAGYFLLPIRSTTIFGGVARLKSLTLSVSFVTFFAVVVTIPMILAGIAMALRRLRTASRTTAQKMADDRAPTGAQFALFGTAAGFLLVTGFMVGQWWQPPAFALLAFIRAANLGNGVSPLMPLIFLGTANLCLIGGDLWRLRLLEDCRIKPPFLNFEAGAESFRGTDALEAQVIHFLECSPWELPGTRLLLGFLVISFAYFACSRGLPVVSIDGWTFNWLFFLSAGFIYFYFSILLLRFVWVWVGVHRLLRRLYWHPTRGAYSLLRARSLPESGGQTIRLMEPRPSLTAIEFCLQCVREILDLLSSPADKDGSNRRLIASPGTREELENALRLAEHGLADVLKAQSQSDWRSALIRRMDIQVTIARISSQIVAMFEPAWRLLGEHSRPSLDENDQKAIEQGDLFVAGRVVDFLRQVFPQMRLLSGSAMTGLLTMMLAASVYPFVQRDTLLWVSWIVLLTAVTIGVIVFVQISRSRIVSMLYGTTPGRFSWDSPFTIRILMFGMIPILTLLGAQYPNALGGTISWISKMFGGAPSQ